MRHLGAMVVGFRPMAKTTTKYADAIRDQLKAKREHFGVNLVTISDAMGERGSPMPTVALRRFEEGTRRLTVDEALALLDYLGVTFSTIERKVNRG